MRNEDTGMASHHHIDCVDAALMCSEYFNVKKNTGKLFESVNLEKIKIFEFLKDTNIFRYF